jgi:shikimate dehydrogenase
VTERRLPSRLVLVGHPVAHSLSPRFQNAALRAAGIPLTYEALDVPPAELSVTMRGLRDGGAAGNVTIPHKAGVAAICERLTASARRAGAVNTFWVEDGALVGDNTDIDGVAAAVIALLGDAPHDARIALLGAGGSAAAVLCAAERWKGVRVAIHARSRARAESLAEPFGRLVHIAGSAPDAVRGAALVINATPLGLRDDDAMPIDVGELDHGTAVLDLVYSRNETRWVRAARARGLRAADGLTMLIEQGAASFERWLGVAPDRAIMWSAVR